MFFDNLAYLLTQSDIILLAQLVENKFEFERIKIIFQLQVFFRMIFFNHGNNALRFIKRVVAKLPSDFFFQRPEIGCIEIMTNPAKVNGAHQAVDVFNRSRFRRGNEYAVSRSQKKIKRVKRSARAQIQQNIFVFQFGYGFQCF